MYLAILAHRLSKEECNSLIARLRMSSKVAQAMRHTVKLRQALFALSTPQLSPSSIYHLLKGHSEDAIKATTVATDSPLIRERLGLYLSELRHLKPILNGNDLRAMGVPPGKKMGEVLDTLLDARLNGEVETEEEERELVRRLLSNEP
jgi:tRNA nucleotidyltransferase (CCA-adding enzyme)